MCCENLYHAECYKHGVCGKCVDANPRLEPMPLAPSDIANLPTTANIPELQQSPGPARYAVHPHPYVIGTPKKDKENKSPTVSPLRAKTMTVDEENVVRAMVEISNTPPKPPGIPPPLDARMRK